MPASEAHPAASHPSGAAPDLSCQDLLSPTPPETQAEGRYEGATGRTAAEGAGQSVISPSSESS